MTCGEDDFVRQNLIALSIYMWFMQNSEMQWMHETVMEGVFYYFKMAVTY
jgi:hypothetical protein